MNNIINNIFCYEGNLYFTDISTDVIPNGVVYLIDVLGLPTALTVPGTIVFDPDAAGAGITTFASKPVIFNNKLFAVMEITNNPLDIEGSVTEFTVDGTNIFNRIYFADLHTPEERPRENSLVKYLDEIMMVGVHSDPTENPYVGFTYDGYTWIDVEIPFNFILPSVTGYSTAPFPLTKTDWLVFVEVQSSGTTPFYTFIFCTNDTGRTWQFVGRNYSFHNAIISAKSSQQILYAIGRDNLTNVGQVYKSIDAGYTWLALPDDPDYDMFTYDTRTYNGLLEPIQERHIYTKTNDVNFVITPNDDSIIIFN